MRMIGRFFLVFLCLFSASALYAKDIKPTNTAFRTFWHPTYLGQRLNYCSFDGSECGSKLANRYCRMLGYDRASQSLIAYHVGLTNFLDTRARCVGWRCNGFMNINCAKNLAHKPPRSYHYRKKQFFHPRYNLYRLDYCYKRERGCGKRAANSFCSRMGYMQASRFEIEKSVSATKTIGSQELCFGKQCHGFELIICYR